MAPRRIITPHKLGQEADKENNGNSTTPMVAKPHLKGKKKPLGDKSNVCSMERELEALTTKLNKISLEKEMAEQLLQAQEATIKEQKQQLELRETERKLEDKLKKLQKLKAFTPTLSLPLAVSLDDDQLSKKKKKNNDPTRVKKPLPAFLLWCKDQREQIKADNPQASFKEMSVILGEKWKSLSDEEKKTYEDKYQIEKEVYLKLVGKEKRDAEAIKLVHEEQSKKCAMELLEQYLQHMKESSTDGKSKKKEKDPEKPKQPISAFFAFCNERRASLMVEKLKVPEIGKILGNEWKNMDAGMRAPYEKIAAEAKAKYAEDLQVYKQKKSEEASAAKKALEERSIMERSQGLLLLKQKEKIDQAKKVLKEQKLQKRKVKIQLTDPNKPKKPPTSFLLFGMDARKSILENQPRATFSDITAIVSSKWKGLDAEEKQVWADKAAKAMEKYKKDMDEYKLRQGSNGAVQSSASA
ncbi:hypothetical protein O6H91_22G032800 [Diphasiastrum complanatum]|uniref:Uncharacterized protein n=1 Tax=Diphasiastrum complanatum TaxID=34168 RepID=A0ACC2AE68_DIPCM|nr:hypothetical protein O6H91_22G032800 [Diphasiastrum complanatum]